MRHAAAQGQAGVPISCTLEPVLLSHQTTVLSLATWKTAAGRVMTGALPQSADLALGTAHR